MNLVKIVMVLLVILILGGCSFLQRSKNNKEKDKNKTVITVHYSRFENDYDGVELVAWATGSGLKKFDFDKEDEFGKVATVKLDKLYDQVGLTVLKDSKKVIKTNRYVKNIKDGKAEVWLVQKDEKIYYNREKADNSPRIYEAKIQGSKEIEVELSNEVKEEDEFKVIDLDGNDYEINSLKKIGDKKYIISMKNRLDMAKKYEISSDLFKKAITKMGDALEEEIFTYDGDDLGNTYTPEKTTFKVWTPVAKKVDVLIYDNSEDDTPEVYSMERAKKGIWQREINKDLENKQYKYRVNIYGDINETVDPYAKALNTNGQRGIIFDLEKTDPNGWSDDKKPVINEFTNTNRYVDHVIWEVHVRDFSMAENSGMKYKGKYLAFTEEDTNLPENKKIKTGISHLKELGITTVHLNPVYDFETVDESGEGDNYYNWGYDPYQYNVPEGSYATNPDDLSRVIEFKKMVQALHANGFRVVMDVVYNHTFATGNSIFDELVPKYYYRINEDGEYYNGSGCGNEVATEKPMVRKFIIDSLKYWATEYNIDGFRFDLMGIMDVETMDLIENELHAIDDSIILYGEPWSAGNAGLEVDKQFGKGTQKDMNIAVFNDNIREAIKGGNDGVYPGFAMGKRNKELFIKRGVVGSINYNEKIKDFTANPGESINYASAHDNLTLWDKLKVSFRKEDEQERIKMDRLSQAIVLTSQGVPFILAGEELLRSKNENHNSYKAGDEDNMIRWERKEKYMETFEYYEGLIKLRKEHSAFRMDAAESIKENLKFYDLENDKDEVQELVVSYTLNGKKVEDTWDNIFVIYNGNREEVNVSVPTILQGEWDMVVNGEKAGTEVIKKVDLSSGEITLPGSSAVILKK